MPSSSLLLLRTLWPKLSNTLGSQICLTPENKMIILMVLIQVSCVLASPHSVSEVPSLRFEKERCNYDGYSLSEGGSLRLGDPCVKLTCMFSKKELVVNGCPPPSDYNNEEENDPVGVMYWPHCCNKT
ncbi:uncharacterized protein LOC125945642 isoform X1 [Dermacentor silvarum]|uniref:uncharacterized protein LOC125945642 isoform X1 n=1 Tax=Dermacentor silvarum TaxID=543639 RepID=UPI002101B7C7|nr:uncharacterized protein LOC125945642 isoform X1 [Dermacentor silvarum]